MYSFEQSKCSMRPRTRQHRQRTTSVHMSARIYRKCIDYSKYSDLITNISSVVVLLIIDLLQCNRGECQSDNECSENRACINYSCVDPCIGQVSIVPYQFISIQSTFSNERNKFGLANRLRFRLKKVSPYPIYPMN